jgi:hypothetical protein
LNERRMLDPTRRTNPSGVYFQIDNGFSLQKHSVVVGIGKLLSAM